MPETRPLPQGYAHRGGERLPLPPADAMNEAQRQAAQALIDGPRKGVYGPFLPLLRSPVLLDRVAKTGEYLRFDSVLDARERRHQDHERFRRQLLDTAKHGEAVAVG